MSSRHELQKHNKRTNKGTYNEVWVVSYWFFPGEVLEEVTTNCYVVEKRIVSKLSKILITNFKITSWRLEWRLCPNFMFLSFVPSEKLAVIEHYDRAGSSRTGTEWFIALYDSASPKIIIEFISIFLGF